MSFGGRLSGKSTFPLSTLDPDAAFEDLEPLIHCIGEDVRIVAIGESVHAAHEFYALRHRLIRFLVERMNFTAIVWESGFPESFLADDYIQGGALDRARVQIEGMSMHLGRCDEMGELLDWLREHNARAAKRVRFHGLDLPGSSAALVPVLDVIARYLEAVDPGFDARLSRLRELAASYATPTVASNSSRLEFAGTIAIRRYMALPAADRNELTALLADMAARFDALERTYVEHSDATRYDFNRQYVRVAIQLDVQLRAVAALMSGDAAACEANIRDLTMADTVDWILERHDRVVVAAHNGHIQKTPIATPTGTADGVDTVGVHLARRWGQQYYAIGTTCGDGEMVAMRTVAAADRSCDSELYIRNMPPAEPDTLDAVLNSQLSQLAAIDLRSLDPEPALIIDAVRTMRMQDQLIGIDARKAFDMIVHLPLITIWTSEVNATMPDERGK